MARVNYVKGTEKDHDNAKTIEKMRRGLSEAVIRRTDNDMAK